jgi:hypothetical protein
LSILQKNTVLKLKIRQIEIFRINNKTNGAKKPADKKSHVVLQKLGWTTRKVFIETKRSFTVTIQFSIFGTSSNTNAESRLAPN